jgi:hypothetical protein
MFIYKPKINEQTKIWDIYPFAKFKIHNLINKLLLD